MIRIPPNVDQEQKRTEKQAINQQKENSNLPELDPSRVSRQ